MSLAEDAKAAKAAGVSYGTYMMGKGFKPYLKPEGKRCVNCGGVLYGGQQRFCSRECREEWDGGSETRRNEDQEQKG